MTPPSAPKRISIAFHTELQRNLRAATKISQADESIACLFSQKFVADKLSNNLATMGIKNIVAKPESGKDWLTNNNKWCVILTKDDIQILRQKLAYPLTESEKTELQKFATDLIALIPEPKAGRKRESHELEISTRHTLKNMVNALKQYATTSDVNVEFPPSIAGFVVDTDAISPLEVFQEALDTSKHNGIAEILRSIKSHNAHQEIADLLEKILVFLKAKFPAS